MRCDRFTSRLQIAYRPDIVSLPEVWDSLGGDRTVRNANAELLPAKGSNEPGGEAYEFMRETARRLEMPASSVAKVLKEARPAPLPAGEPLPTPLE